MDAYQGRFGDFSASTNGTLVYRTGASGDVQFAWLDRHGTILGTVGEPGAWGLAALAPDSARVAAVIDNGGHPDIWLIDSGRTTRFTFGPGLSAFPVWSPDGTRIAFASIRSGHQGLYTHAANFSGDDQVLLESDDDKRPMNWSPDGRYLLYQVQDPKNGSDLWYLPLEGDRKPVPFLRTPFDETDAEFSPDGHWVAYASNESGMRQVYVLPFPPGTGGKQQISKGNGGLPHWRRDGKELFYLDGNRKLWAVPITLTNEELRAQDPVVLFPWPDNTSQRAGYQVSPDGKRFLLALRTEQSGSTQPLTVVLNPPALLKR